MNNVQDKNIILFDGVCNFCNSSINFIIQHDKKNTFQFAALQSEKGKSLSRTLSKGEGMKLSFNTVIYSENGVLHTKSTAALRILKKLGGFYSLAYVLIVIPKFIRDFFYDIIARNRYKWFGKRESCMIPTPEVRAKFLN